MKRRITCFLLAIMMIIGLCPIAVLNASAVSNLKTSLDAIELIEKFEGFRSHAYYDYGQYSIGYGTSCGKDEYPNGITEAEAEALLIDRLAKSVEPAVNEFADTYSLNFTQGQFDALVMFTYNVGEGWMSAPGMFRQAVIDGETGDDFVYKMSLWSNAGGSPLPGLLNRRLCEADIYLNGHYSFTARSDYNYVIYNPQGGVLSDKMQGYISTTDVPVRAVPVRTGYQFAGWYTSAQGGQKVTHLTAMHHGTTLYAQWHLGVTVTNATLNVRDNPGAGNSWVATLSQGDKVVVLNTQTVGDQVWGQIENGWIDLEYTNYEVLKDEEDSTDAPVIASGVVKVNDYLNVRQGPGTHYPQVGKLLPGAKVEFTKFQKVGYADWGRTKDGWVCMDYIVLDKEGESGPAEPDVDNPDTDKPDTNPPDVDTPDPDVPGDSAVLYTGTVINTNSLRVRQEPGTKNKQVGTLVRGEKVEILEEREVDDAPWGRIASGWICLLYIEADPSQEDLTNAKYGYVISFSPLNIRSAPGAHNLLRGTLNPGTIIPIFEEVQYNNETWGRTKRGWVCMKYVTIDPNLKSDEVEVPDGGGDVTPDVPDEGPVPPGTTPLYTGSVYGTYNLRLRTGPGTNYAEVTQLTYGYKLNIYEVRPVNNLLWGRVDKGWVCLTYVELDPTPANVRQPLTATVETYTPLKIRKGPDVSYEQLGLLTNGDVVTIYEIDNSGKRPWGRIDNGWICLDYVHIAVPAPGSGSETPTPPVTPTDPTESTGGTETTVPDTTGSGDTVYGVHYTGKVILTNSLRVRSGAGVNNPEVGLLTLGTKVQIDAVVAVKGVNWGHISQGWICLDYVEIDPTAENARYTLTGKVNVTNVNLKVRQDAGVQYAIVGELTNGTKITVYEIKLVNKVAWGRTDNGWVCLQYVVLSVPDVSKLPDDNGSGDNGGDTGNDNTGGDDNNNGDNPGDTVPDVTEPPAELPGQGPLDPGAEIVLTGKIIKASTKVYDAASTEGKQIGTMNVGSKVELYQVMKAGNARWGRTDKGWINVSNVELDQTKENLTRPLEGTVNTASDGGIDLKVRAGAGTGYAQVKTIPNGGKVTVYNLKKDSYYTWGRIDEGWVCMNYVILQVPDPAVYNEEPKLPVAADAPVFTPEAAPKDPELLIEEQTNPDTPKEDVKHLVIVVEDSTFSSVNEYPNLESVNFLNSTCYDSIVNYQKKNPDVKVTYQVSLGTLVVPNTVTALDLSSGKFNMDTLIENLAYLPDVKAIHFRKTDLSLAEIKAFEAHYSDKISVTYSVAIGANEVRSDATSAELHPDGMDYNTLIEELPMLPGLKKVTLRNTTLKPAELAALKEMKSIEWDYTVYIAGQEWASNTTTVHASSLVTSQIDSAVANFALLPALKEVVLVNDKGISNLKIADVKTLMTLAPSLTYQYSVDFYGTKVNIYDEEVRIVGKYIGDAGEQKIRDLLFIMQNCSYMLLDDCDISNEVMAKLRDDFRGTTKIVWRVYFASHKDQPNFPRNSLSDATVIRSCYGLDDTNCENVKYFEDAEYIDFGHNTKLTNLDYIAYMPNLKYIILSGSAITNLDAFANHENLIFLEAGWCSQLTDISALATCPNLKWLNISYTRPKDVTLLYDLPLEILHCTGGAVTTAQAQTLRAKLPNCTITYTGTDHIGTGWRYINGKQTEHEALRQEVFREFLDGK